MCYEIKGGKNLKLAFKGKSERAPDVFPLFQRRGGKQETRNQGNE
jgi:hypothetical protein